MAAEVIGVPLRDGPVCRGRPSDAILVFVFTMYTRFGLTECPYSFFTEATTSAALAFGFFFSTVRTASVLFFLGSERSVFDWTGFLAIGYLVTDIKRVRLSSRVLVYLYLWPMAPPECLDRTAKDRNGELPVYT